MVGLLLNIFVYSICLFLFNVETVIYSLIYGIIFAILCDKVHMQNINIQVLIFTKQEGVDSLIMQKTGRGATKWEGAGAYTGEDTHIICTMISQEGQPSVTLHACLLSHFSSVRLIATP